MNNYTMTVDAALVACEGVPGITINSDLRLQVDTLIAPLLEKHQPFGKFLERQRAAVKALYDCPEAFGGES